MDIEEPFATPRDFDPVPGSPGILISTPTRIGNLLADRRAGSAELVGLLRHRLGLIVMDEAQRGAARSYRRILDILSTPEHPVTVVGLTGTPFPELCLGRVWQRAPHTQRDLRKATRADGEPGRASSSRTAIDGRPRGGDPGNAADAGPLRLEDFPHGTDITEAILGQINPILANRCDPTRRMRAILRQVLGLAVNPENRILYYAPSVRDAEIMAMLLRRHGVASRFVGGRTRKGTRRQIVRDFKQMKIQVLCSCEVLTNGFDALRVTHIILARPTRSLVLYQQMVGRGLRGKRFGGTESCAILECDDIFVDGPPELGYEVIRPIWTEEPQVVASRPRGRVTRPPRRESQATSSPPGRKCEGPTPAL